MLFYIMLVFLSVFKIIRYYLAYSLYGYTKGFVLHCSYYDNICDWLSLFETSGTCPTQLVVHGLPCTCPFNPSTINLPPSLFHVTHLNTEWLIVATVSVGLISK